MRWRARTVLIALAMAAALPGIAQRDDPPESSTVRIDRRGLLDRTIVVPGMGRSVPGIDLLDRDRARFFTGDDSLYAARKEPGPRASEPPGTAADVTAVPTDSLLPATVHWLRIPLRVDPELIGEDVLLRLMVPGMVSVFVNGERVFEAGTDVLWRRSAVSGTDASPPAIPVRFQVDGCMETIAVRMLFPDARPLPREELHASLHLAASEREARVEHLNAGLFVGVNLVIFLLSIILWSFDRNDRNWLLLSAITFITAFKAFAVVVEGWDLGFSSTARLVVIAIAGPLMPWPSYLLILLLRRLLGLARWRWSRFYTVGLVLASVLLVIAGILDARNGGGDTTITSDDLPVALLIVLVPSILVVLAAIFGLLIQALRLGLKLLRMQGYERWIGMGALIASGSSLLSGALKLLGTPGSSWLFMASDYFDQVGLSIAAAVFMAIRSAHHNRAVARQRDDLDREVNERTAELRQERDRSNELLLNILPHEVAEELKEKGAAQARHFDQATVMFTDFKGFTSMSEQVEPALLLAELNACFKAFDDIIGARGIEKIKTIGDAYMCASGLPDPKSASPADVVFAALEMQDFMERRRAEREKQGLLAFVMRVGIHTGPVVAGIVGVKKFQYDIWGDTVNTAARMESSGEEGRVNISDSTWSVVRDTPGLSFTPRGKVRAKGKGEMEMWFVQRS